MGQTLREALMQRRNEYLFRSAIFDSLECPIDVDYRASLVRRFLVGGDDVDPSIKSFTNANSVNRPPLFTGKEAEDAIDAMPMIRTSTKTIAATTATMMRLHFRTLVRPI